MGEQPAGRTKKPTNPRVMALVGAATIALSIINMSDSEAPSQAVALMQYAFLAAGCVSLGVGLIMMISAPAK
jgi:hypothetical protein